MHVLQLLALVEHPDALPADAALRLGGEIMALIRADRGLRRCDAVEPPRRIVKTRGIGTLARTLLVAPETTAGTRLWREPTMGSRWALERYERALAAFLDRPPRCSPDDPGVLDPPALTLTGDARREWIAFHDQVELSMRTDGEFVGIRAFASKMPEHAGRLAAVIQVMDDPHTMEVSRGAMRNGITLARHYAAELLRLKDAASVQPDLLLAARLLAWWQARPDSRCHLAIIYQLGPYAVRDAATARRIVGVLEDHRWVRRLDPGAIVDGAARRDAWELVP